MVLAGANQEIQITIWTDKEHTNSTSIGPYASTYTYCLSKKLEIISLDLFMQARLLRVSALRGNA